MRNLEEGEILEDDERPAKGLPRRDAGRGVDRVLHEAVEHEAPAEGQARQEALPCFRASANDSEGSGLLVG